MRSGLISELDVAQAETQLPPAEAQQADVVRQRRDTEHALALLCGSRRRSSTSRPRRRARALPEVPAGVPSQLLERRPDVAEAEADARGGERADRRRGGALLPLGAARRRGGLESADASTDLDWESRAYSLGPSVSVPIFEGGHLVANLDEARAAYEAEAAAFRQTVLAAFRDVEDALTDVHQRRVQREALDGAVASARKAVKVARIQYVGGLVDYLSVVVTEQARLNLELQQAQVAQQQLIASALLVKALGGGWH